MEQRKLARWLKGVLIGMALCGAAIFFYIFPVWGKALAAEYTELAGCYWPWLIFLWISALPCYGVLWCGWHIACEIGRDNSFSRQNAAQLKRISLLAAIDALFFAVGNMVFLLLGWSHPAVTLAGFLIVFAGVAVAVAAAVLARLVYKSAILKEENELTI